MTAWQVWLVEPIGLLALMGAGLICAHVFRVPLAHVGRWLDRQSSGVVGLLMLGCAVVLALLAWWWWPLG
jgi:hypothetical protein